jgi:hypothetical protein
MDGKRSFQEIYERFRPGVLCILYHDELNELACEPKPTFGSI